MSDDVKLITMMIGMSIIIVVMTIIMLIEKRNEKLLEYIIKEMYVTLEVK